MRSRRYFQDRSITVPDPRAGRRRKLHSDCAQLSLSQLRRRCPVSTARRADVAHALGGDLDGRLKTLFDALKMPDPKDPVYKGNPPTDDPLYVVLEDDALISDFSVKSGRLLGRGAKKKHEVRLTVDITIKVLRVFPQNQILIGG
jgi:hypothetical protein